ncbi:MAG TPA: hypothetical protein VGJ00_07320 [Rhabdochlamydiaceae bacterium]
MSKIICLIACHAGPADHFVTFAEKLTEEGYQVQVYASGPALKKFQERQIPVEMAFNADDLSQEAEVELAARLAKKCSPASVVLTDMGHPFDIQLHKSLAVQSPQVLRIAYYDNPEPFVPGGYSRVAAGVLAETQKVLFANANLEKAAVFKEIGEEIALSSIRRVGVGYYPIAQAERVASRRSAGQKQMRTQFLSQQGIEDKGQKVLVYFGGNNEEYYGKAFPAFLDFLSEGMQEADLSRFILVLQQHPGAKSKNLDRRHWEAWMSKHGKKARAPKMIISEGSSEEMQVLAEGALYYQTSMGPLFALAGISLVQVGHKVYEDVLVKGHLCSIATTPSQLVRAIAAIQPKAVSDEDRRALFASLGIKENWYQELKRGFESNGM